MENFSQDSNKSKALKARMDELKAQLEKTQEEYDRVRQEEFKEAVRKFLDEFNIRTIEDLNNVAMKLRGMKPEIVKEAAKNIRTQKTVASVPRKNDADTRKSYYRPSKEPAYASRKVASEKLEKLAETTKSLFVEKAARKEEPVMEEPPVEEKTEVFFDDTEKTADDNEPAEEAEELIPVMEYDIPVMEHDEKKVDEPPVHEDLSNSNESVMDDTVYRRTEDPREEVEETLDAEEDVNEAPEAFAKADSFDLDDGDIDMNWDFGDDDDSKEQEPAAEPAPAKTDETEEVTPMSAADIDALTDELGKVELSDEQVAALRNKAVVVRAANKLTRALFTAEQELGPFMPIKEVSTLFDYDSAAMTGTSIREKYAEADKMIAALDGNITEQNTPDAYPIYAEFKDFPDFIRNRAMTLVAMELEEYFA